MRFPERWSKERAASLKALGMRDYVDYLASPLWAVIRRRVYARANGLCESAACTKPASAVHHWSYSLATMRGQSLKHLQAVCETCHKRYHRIDKLSDRQVRRRAWRAWMASGGACGQKVATVPRLVAKA